MSGRYKIAKYFVPALLGWYLLLPPWVAPYKVNEKAPFSQWKSGANKDGKACVFPSFQACADFKTTTMNALKNGQVKQTSNGATFSPALLDWNYRVYWNGRCVEIE